MGIRTQGHNYRTMGANIHQQLCGKYAATPEGDYKPFNSELRFILQIRASKYIGRPKYLQLRATDSSGNLIAGRPMYISSIYEPRTEAGIGNIEVERKRYELNAEGSGGISISPLPYRKQQGSGNGKVL